LRGAGGPIADADDATPQQDGGSVARYEAVRVVALGQAPAGHQHSLAVLRTRGVAAWMRVWRSSPASPDVGPARAAVRHGAGELVSVLAAMAPACVGSR
jgi:hypothetical protein